MLRWPPGAGVGELYNSEGLTHAASIAYYALLSLFPFLLLALSILGELTADAAERDAVVGFVFRYFPRQFDFITGQLDAFRPRRVQLRRLAASSALVWASLGVFNAMTSAVNHAWGWRSGAASWASAGRLPDDGVGRRRCCCRRS